MRHGGQILVDQLKLHQVDRVFSVPGESFLAALDGLVDSGIHNIVCRHEGGAAMMAEATGKLTGRPGVAFVTRGPGATNASAGVHIAAQDSTPMVLFVGQIERGHRDREAFQELNYRAVFGTIAKWVTEVDDTHRLPELINRAFHTAQSGRPGPVVVALPEEVLSASSDAPALTPGHIARPSVAPQSITAIRDFLSGAKRPLVIAGGSMWSQAAADGIQRFCEGSGLPLAVTFRRQDHVDNSSDIYVGDIGVGANPWLTEMLGSADRLLILGARFGDIATNGYDIIKPENPRVRIAHVYPDASVPNSVYPCDFSLVADPAQVAKLLGQSEPVAGDWTKWTQQARDAYNEWQVPKTTPGDVTMEFVISWLTSNLPSGAILTNGAGNYAAFLHRYFCFHQYGTQLAPTSGSMGYGFPAAVAASIAHPDRPVVCLAGDGCFQMTLNEMSTARQFGATPIVVVANNGQYGTIRMHQERTYPGRVSGTALFNPDFAALARSFGGHGEVVEANADFSDAFERARASGKVAVIELRLDPEALTSGQTLTQIRDAATGN